MKTLIQFTFFLCIGILSCNAQSQFSSDQLIGTTWTPVIQPPVCIDTISYTKTKKIMKAYFPKLKRTVVSYNNYYLSDTIPSAFDYSQVNKTTIGNYMISYNPYMKDMTYHRIITLDIANRTLILERYNSLRGCFEPVEYRLVKSE